MVQGQRYYKVESVAKQTRARNVGKAKRYVFKQTGPKAKRSEQKDIKPRETQTE